jgi:hypothetical protein
MSQCSITGKGGRANNAGGIARTIGGIERTYSTGTFVRALNAQVALLQVKRKLILAKVSTNRIMKSQHVRFIKDVYGTE